MTRKPRPRPAEVTVIATSPPARRGIVATNKLPKIGIRVVAVGVPGVGAYGDIRITIPGYHLATVALAHSIVAAFLYELTELEWSLILAPRVEPGDRLMTCTIIAIDPVRDAGAGVGRSVFTSLACSAARAAKRVCRRPVDGVATHTIVVEEVRT